MALKQLTVKCPNRPGVLAKIAAAVGDARVNLHGIYAPDSGPRGAVRLLVGDATRAASALRKAGFRPKQEPVVILRLADKPGSFGRAAAKLARAGVNIRYSYATSTGLKARATVVLGVSNAAKARRVLR